MEDLPLLQQSKVLITADNFRLTAPVLEALSQTHLHLRLAPRTRAISAYKEWAPDLIIVDLQTQYSHGVVGLAQLKSLVQDAVPVLVLAGSEPAGSPQEALRLGAKDVLVLPSEPTTALARVQNLLELHHLKRRLREPHTTTTSQDHHRTHETHGIDNHLCQQLTRLLTCRDRATGTHAMRMSHYAAALGRAAGPSAAESELLQRASPLHDIGKIAIPDRILLKPAPLDPDEWAMIRTHPTIGAELLAGGDSALLRLAHDTALTHHEKWDGSGYPQGLKGEAIPLVGRITAICDVFDALTSVRPYKPAWPVQDAVASICQQSGRHFEPQLVKQFCTILPTLLTIKAQYTDPNPAA